MKKNHLITFELSNNIYLSNKDIENIDNYLENFFKINIDNSIKRMINTKSIIQRVLKLTLNFLQALKIPIFNEGIIHLLETDKKLKISISFEYIDYIPKEIYNSIFNKSINIIFTLLIKLLNKKNILYLNKVIDEQIIKPYYNISGSSKSTMAILETVHKLGIPFRHLSRGLYILGWGKESISLLSSSIGSDSKVGSQVVGNKMITAIMLKDLGLPYPRHKLINKKEQCENASKIIGFPLVVKPVDENEGRGVFIDIENLQQLYKAFDKAKTFSRSGQILIEKQIKGTCHRIFIVKQKILYVVKRHPKSIKADGESTIKELIKKANKENELLITWNKSEFFPSDNETIEVISDLNFTLDSIPKKDMWIPLRKIESSQFGGRNEDFTNDIHPENVDIALRAAKFFGMDVAGIDIISEDISVPWHKNKAVINEVNFAPQLGRDSFTKNRINTFVQTIIKNKGRIPIKAIKGREKALKKAIQMQKESLRKGINSYLTTHNRTFSSSNMEIYYESQLLNQRINHLLLEKDIEELIIVIQNNDFELGNNSDYIDIITLKENN